MFFILAAFDKLTVLLSLAFATEEKVCASDIGARCTRPDYIGRMQCAPTYIVSIAPEFLR
jgi:hypothetical protein